MFRVRWGNYSTIVQLSSLTNKTTSLSETESVFANFVIMLISLPVAERNREILMYGFHDKPLLFFLLLMMCVMKVRPTRHKRFLE